jgi:hypothetical protein
MYIITGKILLYPVTIIIYVCLFRFRKFNAFYNVVLFYVSFWRLAFFLKFRCSYNLFYG